MDARVVWLYGPSGVGKTSVGWELFRRLRGVGVPAGFVDTDQLGLCYPPSGEDPDNHRLKARNLAAVLRAFRAAGARLLVVSGYLNDAEVAAGYAAGVGGVPVVLCRLRAEHSQLRARFERRGLATHLVEETLAEADELDRTDFADVVVDTSELSVAEVASQVWERAAGLSRRWRAAPEAALGGGTEAGTVPVLWLCGPPAVGKSTVGYEVFTQVNRDGVRAAYLDLHRSGSVRRHRMW